MVTPQSPDTQKIFFVSYSRKDDKKVSKLIQALREIDHDVWYDKHLVGGQQWWDEIIKQIYKCHYFIFALSRNAWYSEACRKELEFAHDLNKWIIPVVVSGDFEDYHLPDWLASLQHINYDSSNLLSKSVLAELARDLPEPKPIPFPTPQAPSPPQWFVSLFRKFQRYALTIGIVLVAAIAIGAYFLLQPRPVKIAVKYFQSSEAPVSVVLSDTALVEEITCHLQDLEGAIVVGPNHVKEGVEGVMLASVGKPELAAQDQMLKQAKVTHLLQGEIRHDSILSTVSIELVKRFPKKIILRDTFYRHITKANAQDIVHELAESVRNVLDLKAIERLETRDLRLDPTSDEASLEKLSLARRAWRLRTQESMHEAIILLEQAITANPDFWRAHGFLALVYATGAEGGELADSLKPYHEAKYHAEKAIANMSGSAQVADALVALGDCYEHERNYLGAEEQYKKAIEVDDSHATAHQALAELYLKTGQHDLATIYMNRAFGQEMWGNPTVMWLRSKLLIAAGDHEGGNNLAAKVLELDPGYIRALNHLWEFHLINGDFDLALQECENAPNAGYAFVQKALSLLEAKQYEAFDTLMLNAPAGLLEDLQVLAYFERGDAQSGLTILTDLMEQDAFNFLWILQTDPYRICDNINRHPGACDLMKSYGITLRRHPDYR